jgi:hypothetical protein
VPNEETFKESYGIAAIAGDWLANKKRIITDIKADFDVFI